MEKVLDQKGQDGQEHWTKDPDENPEGEELAEPEFADDEPGDDEAFDDEAFDDEALDDEALDDEALDDEALDDEPADEDVQAPATVASSRYGLVTSVVVLTAVAASVSYALGSGLIAAGVAGVWLAVAIPVTVSPVVYWLCMKQARREGDAWETESEYAVRLLASEDVPDFRGAEPLAEVLAEVAEGIHAKAIQRLSDQGEELKAEAHRDLVRVRSHCEQLIEKHAERMLREKLEVALAFQQQKDSGQEVVDARDKLEQTLEKSSSTSDELRERVRHLEEGMAQKVEEVARVLVEVKRLNDENASLKLNSVKFFDKVAAQLRGSIKIVNKLLNNMSSDHFLEGTPDVSGKSCRPAAEYIAEIASRTRQLDRIIDQVLDLCRIESSGLSLVYSEVDTVELVKSCVTKLAPTATAKGVQLTADGPHSAPMVATDARLLGRIVREISTNAVSFTPNGGRVTVSVAMSPQGPAGEREKLDPDMAWLQVTIKDTGPGIPQEERGRIFKAFERGSEPHYTMVDAGAGLGLTLSKHYAALLGGEVCVECKEGQGSAFVFHLPVKVLHKASIA